MAGNRKGGTKGKKREESVFRYKFHDYEERRGGPKRERERVDLLVDAFRGEGPISHRPMISLGSEREIFGRGRTRRGGKHTLRMRENIV